MNDDVDRFCTSVHEKLETLQGRMETLKLNIGATSHLLQEKVAEVRNAREVRQLTVNEARTSLEQWTLKLTAESKNGIDQEIRNHETRYLTERAKLAERCVDLALMLAEASIDDAEWMILEAIAARRDAEAVTGG
jgi:hypothetical protein